LFIDYQQAFDSLNRSAIIITLINNGVPDKIVNLIDMTLKNAIVKIKIGGSISDLFNIDSGVRRRDALSVILLNIVLYEAVKHMIRTGSIINKSWQICAYAHDIVIIARTEGAKRKVYCNIEIKGRTVGLKIN